MGVYLTQNCLNRISVENLIYQPYVQGINNLKLFFLNINYANELSKNIINNLIQAPSLTLRVKHLLASVILMIPIINSLALIILRRLDLRTQHSASKIQSTFRGWKTRKDLKQQKGVVQAKQEKAAVKIQAAFRGWRTRHTL